ncbi:MAG: lipocalin-like domain-containing protein [Bacteroidales bacterium]|nr:lipocalin-like domain-containing protein [Bacteroidales bacterium]
MQKVIAFILFIALVSCTKDYNSDLRGRWQLRTEVKQSIQNQVDTIFYSFDNHVLDIQKKQNEFLYSQLFARFTQVGDSLFFDFVDAKVPYSQHYKIEKINSTTLQLKSVEHELLFRKF